MDTTLNGSMIIDSAVYQTAMLLDGIERERFLKQVFGDDIEKLARMNRLLRKAGEASAFFLEAREHQGVLAGEVLEHADQTSQTAEEAAAIDQSGSRIGPYRLLFRIGEGGCGVIYEAEQLEPVHRRVALKIIRLGMDTESVIARFEAERQALALMDHPNIARVFDAGATATGRPYFVMERVSGERITTCCDRERLGIVARIQLFIQVCHGIQHAHQKGVIHRDIKPNNVLVSLQDGRPVPKIIDFGIAKATGSSGLSGRTPWTARDQIMGTPPYMSPEQVDMGGIDVDTRSDVYSLGALLYELLTGRAPFDGQALANAGVSEMRRVLLEVEPSRPSRLLAELPPAELTKVAASRNDEPARLIARLKGDLDWIVARAMAKDRNRRYQTVNALTADLQHFLRNEPITAREPSKFYLIRKFVRRNRLTCLLGGAVVVSLMGGLGASTFLYWRERVALAEQERLGHEAEAARAQEFRLREQAQARANVSQVAVLLSEGRIAEADALLRESPLESIEPSREAAGVFRALGNWNAIYRRWNQAAQCYVLLDQANRLDNSLIIVEQTDLLEIGPALLKSGDREAYDKFRQNTLDRHLPVKNSLQAEHILKVCLLAPANQEMLERLRNVAEMCARGVPTESGLPSYPHWEAFSLTLYHHRLGQSEKTIEWGTKSLSYPDPTGARTAATLSLMAVAKFRTGRMNDALADIRESRRLIAVAAQSQSIGGTWYSWAIAEILLDEAEREISTASL